MPTLLDLVYVPAGSPFSNMCSITNFALNLAYYLIFSSLMVFVVYRLGMAIYNITRADGSEAMEKLREEATDIIVSIIGLLVLSSALFFPKMILQTMGVADDKNPFIDVGGCGAAGGADAVGAAGRIRIDPLPRVGGGAGGGVGGGGGAAEAERLAKIEEQKVANRLSCSDRGLTPIDPSDTWNPYASVWDCCQSACPSLVLPPTLPTSTPPSGPSAPSTPTTTPPPEPEIVEARSVSTTTKPELCKNGAYQNNGKEKTGFIDHVLLDERSDYIMIDSWSPGASDGFTREVSDHKPVISVLQNPNTGDQLKLMTYNILLGSENAARDMTIVANYILSQNIGIISIQEGTPSEFSELLKVLNKNAPGRFKYNSVPLNNFTNAIFYDSSVIDLNSSEQILVNDFQRNAITSNFTTPIGDLRIFNFHPAAGNSCANMQMAGNRANLYSGTNEILMGDFNARIDNDTVCEPITSTYHFSCYINP